MISPFSAQPSYRSAPLTVDTNHAQQKYMEEDDSGLLDENVLEHQSAVDSGLELSPPMVDSRRDSFVMGPSLFSPQSVDMQSVPSNNPFEPHGSNPFVNMDQTQPFMVPSAPWTFGHGSGSGTPVQHFDSGVNDLDNHTALQRSMTGPTPFSAGNMFSNLGSANPSMPNSPQGTWMNAQSSNKRPRPNSPGPRSHNELRRGDGIRKKNARFDIPAERNLSNIDHLIAMTVDEAELKELKQQKRLLRNRQAALDSRQRKKMHTERLEDEKKIYTMHIQGLEDEKLFLKKQLDQLMAERQSFILERDEMIRQHTIETGELRKQLTVLKDHAQQMDKQYMSPEEPQPQGFVGSYNGHDGMAVSGPWNPNHFIHDFPVEPEQDIKPNMALVQAKKSEVSSQSPDKASPPSSLLFMLFLVGAFVLSNRSSQPIPAVSEDVRAASASLLNTVFQDAGVSSGSQDAHAVAPRPSGATPWASAVQSMMPGNNDSDGQGSNELADLSETLTQPTQDQTNEQIFSLSAAQYNNINDQEFLHNTPSKPTSQGRRNLADALAAMRMTNKQTGAADVYTRTLLWDQIPRDVVRNFARMVATSQEAQQCDSTKI